MPGAIAVNRHGRRFCDETQFQDVVMALQSYDRRNREFANLPAFMIFDDSFRERYPVTNAPPGTPAHPSILRGTTLDELAAKIEIDAPNFRNTIALFNKDANAGTDSEFGRGKSAFSRNNAGDKERKLNPQLAPLDKPPYYALRLKMGGVCSAGLMTDTRSRVLDAHGEPIAGLYACGNTAAPSFLGVGYQGGSSIGAGMVFGYLAAEHAAGRS
jgi:succinate dehydrogenase/fumarate reductase flavoprotein subunit